VIWELSSRRVAQVLAEGGHRKPVVALAVSVFMPRPEPSLINPGHIVPDVDHLLGLQAARGDRPSIRTDLD
jgi:hypothetical protein